MKPGDITYSLSPASGEEGWGEGGVEQQLAISSPDSAGI